MSDLVRRAIHRYVPAHLHDPFGLASRMVRSDSPEARFAIWTAILGVFALPLDILLQSTEQRMYREASMPQHPVIFIAGAPRSGTTITSQVLIRHLPVAYVNNLAAIFPRSPLAANRLFGVGPQNEQVGSTSYYARTTGMSAPNDGLQIWDRWLDAYFYSMPDVFEPATVEGMRGFFGAAERLFDRPILNKTNLLNVAAGLVAEALPTSHFICLVRDPVFHAQSLLVARRNVHGSEAIAYGIGPPPGWGGETGSAIQDVCRQAVYHNLVAQKQASRIGPDRFWVVRYEDFCRDPDSLVKRVGSEVLGCHVPDAALPSPLDASRSRTVSVAEFDAIQEELARLESTPLPDPILPGDAA